MTSDLHAEVTDQGLTVSVDHELCSGSANCAQRAASVFTVSDRLAWVTDPATWTAQDRQRIPDAVEACPWFAISADDTADGD